MNTTTELPTLQEIAKKVMELSGRLDQGVVRAQLPGSIQNCTLDDMSEIITYSTVEAAKKSACFKVGVAAIIYLALAILFIIGLQVNLVSKLRSGIKSHTKKKYEGIVPNIPDGLDPEESLYEVQGEEEEMVAFRTEYANES